MQRNQDSALAARPASIKTGVHLSRFVDFERFLRRLGFLGEVESALFSFRVDNHRIVSQVITATGIPTYLRDLLGYAPTTTEIQSPELLYGRRVLIEVHQRYGLPTITAFVRLENSSLPRPLNQLT